MQHTSALLLALGQLAASTATTRPCPYHRINNNPYEPLLANEYIVKLNESHSLEAHFNFLGRNLSENAADGDFDFMRIFHGYFVRIDDSVLHNYIRHDPGVLYRCLEKRLGRKPRSGEGVDVYVLDTGVRVTHEYLNRHGNKARLFRKRYTDGDDVAGMVKSVAPYSNIVDVNVLGDGTTVYRISKAITDIVEDHENFKRTKGWIGSVINMSFTIDDAQILRDVIKRAITAGIPVVTSAGNSGKKGGTIPLCVSALTRFYYEPSYSNWGDNVTCWAPGHNVMTSTKNADNSCKHMFSILVGCHLGGALNLNGLANGTSFAAPMVAGMMSIFISYEEVNNDAKLIINRLSENWEYDIINLSPDTFTHTGLNNPKRGQAPYYGPPDDELVYQGEEEDQNSDFGVGPNTPIEGPGDKPVDDEIYVPGYRTSVDCNPPSEKWMDKNTILNSFEKFCKENVVSGNDVLRPREGPNTMINAVVNHYDNADTSIRIYAFMDDECYVPGLKESHRINEEECNYAIKRIVDEWKFDEDKSVDVD
ncbi:subtilisin-like protein [Zopfia rhizophila CBS 207.26]|uniref:Subtilisin-like protein n=1 Tax=Zopfia rhizophila CBS 207.26 TaxID=1314779 RepID=A0A6A6EIB1_9PEZI|nr:subtilisin-like protein [Zopfia rhizophila CBS 207.26]